jgi:cell division protein FtsW (lipid II flippase)
MSDAYGAQVGMEGGPRVGRLRTPGVETLLLSLPILFTAVAFTQLTLVDNGRLQAEYYLPVLVLAVCLGGSAWLLRRYLPGHDVLLLPLVGVLVGLGLALVARLVPGIYLTRQLLWLVISVSAMTTVAVLPRNLRWLRRYRYSWLAAGLGLLSLTLILGVNPSGAGARLWLGLGGVYFQPSELLKLILIVFLASYLEDRRMALVEISARIGRLRLPHPAYLGPMLAMWGFSVVLLLWQRDLGAALLFFGVFLAMLYVATGQVGYVVAGTGLLLVSGFLGYRLFDHVALRVDAWWDPWREAAGRSFQLVQSLLAFASGGVFGVGLSQGLPTAIPVVHTDFVFAAVGEEYGLIGTLGVVICFILLTGRAFRIAMLARRPFDQLLASGIGALLAFQSLVIMAGTIKLIPLTGVTLPFVSYGGSSLLISGIMVGLLLFLSNSSGVISTNSSGQT